MRNHPFLAALSAIVLGMPPCAAQEGTVKLRFLTFPKVVEPVKVEMVVGEAKTVKLEVPSNELSPAMRAPLTGAWIFGETTKGPDDKPVFKEFGRAKALASASQLILLVRKGAQPADGLEVVSIDDQVGQFGGGRFLFMNASKVDVAGNVGDEKFVVKPGQHTIIKPNGEGLADCAFYFRKNDEPRPFFSSRWPIGDHARGLVFFYHDPETNHLRFHTIRDYMQEN